MRFPKRGAAAMVAALVLLAGCGGDDDDDGGGGGGGGAASTVNLSATDFKFDPSSVNAQKGEVEFKVTNDGQTAHALEVEGGGVEEVKTDTIDPGSSATLKVDLSKASGDVEFYCPVGNHRAMGMEGKISVDGSASSGGGDKEEKTAGGGYSGY